MAIRSTCSYLMLILGALLSSSPLVTAEYNSGREAQPWGLAIGSLGGLIKRQGLAANGFVKRAPALTFSIQPGAAAANASSAQQTRAVDIQPSFGGISQATGSSLSQVASLPDESSTAATLPNAATSAVPTVASIAPLLPKVRRVHMRQGQGSQDGMDSDSSDGSDDSSNAFRMSDGSSNDGTDGSQRRIDANINANAPAAAPTAAASSLVPHAVPSVVGLAISGAATSSFPSLVPGPNIGVAATPLQPAGQTLVAAGNPPAQAASTIGVDLGVKQPNGSARLVMSAGPPIQAMTAMAHQSAAVSGSLVAQGAAPPAIASTISIKDPQVSNATTPFVVGLTTTTAAAQAAGQGIVAAGNAPAQLASTISIKDPQATGTNVTAAGGLSNSLLSSTLTPTTNKGGNPAAAAAPQSTISIRTGAPSASGAGALATANPNAPFGIPGAQGADACSCQCQCPAGSFPMLPSGSNRQPVPAVGGGNPQAPAGVLTTLITMPGMVSMGSALAGAGGGLVAAGQGPAQVASTISVKDPQAVFSTTNGAAPTVVATTGGLGVAASTASAPGAVSWTTPLFSLTSSSSSSITKSTTAASATGTALAKTNGAAPPPAPAVVGGQSAITVGGSIVPLQSAVTVPLLGRRSGSSLWLVE